MPSRHAPYFFILVNLLGGFGINLELGKSKIHLHIRDSMEITQISVFIGTGTMHWCRHLIVVGNRNHLLA